MNIDIEKRETRHGVKYDFNVSKADANKIKKGVQDMIKHSKKLLDNHPHKEMLREALGMKFCSPQEKIEYIELMKEAKAKNFERWYKQCLDGNTKDAEKSFVLMLISQEIERQHGLNEDLSEIIAAKQKGLYRLSQEAKKIRDIDEDRLEWSEPCRLIPHNNANMKFNSKVPITNTGVYQIIYKPTNEIVYVGIGSDVGSRLARHRRVFLNKGRDLKNPGGTTNPSAVAQNMYKYDSRKSQWLCRFLITGNREFAKDMEITLQEKYNPRFNNQALAGVA